MLPSKKLELAIYKQVSLSEPSAADASLTQLSQIIGEKDHGRIVERLTALDDGHRILLTKWSRGSQVPRAQFNSDVAFFHSGSFVIKIAPQGRSYFEELEQLAEQEKKPMTAQTPIRQASEVDLQIFVSHSSKDRALAEALTDLLESALRLPANQIRCSSVDGHRLPVGVDTQSKLRAEVNAAKVVIGLVTPSSLASSYVMFELGARWGASLFLAPLLAGVDPRGLNGPLSLLNALSASDESQIHQLLDDISGELGVQLQSTISYLKHVSAVKRLADDVSASSQPHGTTAGPPPELEIKQVGAVNYYFAGDKGPYCQPCYDEKGKRIFLTPPQEWNGGTRRKCEVCNKFFYEKPMTDFPGPIFVR
jgi:TIR domain